MTTDSAATASAEVLDDLSGRFLTFYIGDVLYGVELLHVIEIISVQPVTVVPSLPHYLKGIINLRGKVVPVVDVRLKFNEEERAYDEKTCVIVVTIEEMLVGLIVDNVAEVVTETSADQNPPPDLGEKNGGGKYLSSIAKVGGTVILNIDCGKFFQSDLQLY